MTLRLACVLLLATIAPAAAQQQAAPALPPNFADRVERYSFEVPRGWSLEREDPTTLHAHGPDNDAACTFNFSEYAASRNFTAAELDREMREGPRFEEWLKSMSGSLRESRLLRRDSRVINGNRYYHVTFQGVYSDAAEPAPAAARRTMIAMVTMRPGRLYRLVCSSRQDRFARFSTDFAQMIESLRVTWGARER